MSNWNMPPGVSTRDIPGQEDDCGDAPREQSPWLRCSRTWCKTYAACADTRNCGASDTEAYLDATFPSEKGTTDPAKNPAILSGLPQIALKDELSRHSWDNSQQMANYATPRTDAVVQEVGSIDQLDADVVPADFARTLERENAELQKQVRGLQAIAENLRIAKQREADDLRKAKQMADHERDELLARLRTVESHLRDAPEEYDRKIATLLTDAINALSAPSATEPVAWLICYDAGDGTESRIAHTYNAIGDYRQIIDPKATSTPLYAALSGANAPMGDMTMKGEQ